jgi:hypothetical protein
MFFTKNSILAIYTRSTKMTDFNLDQKDLENLTNFFNKLKSKDSKPLVSATLNNQAFATRKANMRVLGRALVVRDDRFFKGSVFVQQAEKFGDPRSNFAEVGSIERDRFSGWEEQQTGKAAPKARVATLAARGGNRQNVMKGRARLKSGNTFRKVSDYKRRKVRKKQALVLMLKETREQKLDFLIRRQDVVGKMKPGLYTWEGNKLLRYQTFGKQYDPKRIDWVGQSLKIVEREADFFDVFADEFKKLAKRRGIRV